MTRLQQTIFCGLLLSLPAFSIDIMLPAFEIMQVELATDMALVQLTVPMFALGLAVSQMVFGPASDRYGRRPTIVTGMVLFLSGAIVAAISPDIETILAGRILQGFGAGSAQVIARAILKDTNTGQALAKTMALAMAIFAVGPIFAPLLGYGLTALGDWRYVFIAMSVFSAMLLGVAMLWFVETNRNIDTLALSPTKLRQSFSAVFRNWQSRTFLLLAVASYCALLSFVTNAPRIYDTAFNITGLGFATMFAITGIGIIFGQIANGRLLSHFGVLSIIRGASFILLVVSTLIVVASWQNMLSAWLFTLFMFLFNTSFLVVISNAASLILDPHKNIAGMASAILGFSNLFGSGIYVTLTLPVFEGDIFTWAVGMSATTGLTFLGSIMVRRKRLTFSHA